MLTAGGCEVHSVRALAPSLEDVFIARVRAAGLAEPDDLSGRTHEVSP
jgi:hypothetical protein